MEFHILIYFLAALFTGSAGAWIIINFGNKFDLLDKPNERSSHTLVTPKGGGIGIVASFAFFSLIFSIQNTFWISATFLAGLSFWGDKSEISPVLRLCFQFIFALILLIGSFHSSGKNFLEYLLIIPFSVFIVGTANYYNFMDGINGIAGITGAIAFGFLSYYASLLNIDKHFIIFLICISCSCIGFLPFNMPDAKVFMGDVGSILLGFIFASIVVLFSRTLLDFICLVSFLFPFYTDELTTLAVRIKDKDKLTRPHRKHLYQLMVNELNIQHWKISVGYGLLQLFIGISILILRPLGIFVVLSVLILYFTGFMCISYLVRKRVIDIENH